MLPMTKRGARKNKLGSVSFAKLTPSSATLMIRQNRIGPGRSSWQLFAPTRTAMSGSALLNQGRAALESAPLPALRLVIQALREMG